MVKIKSIMFILAIFLLITAEAQASILIKVIGLNPSKTHSQKITLKAYLPKEVTPEDILDKGDMDVTYDTQQGAYYVFGEYELKPEESIEREVEIKDIWLIPETEIENLRQEAQKAAKLLEKSELADRVSFLQESIEMKLDEIIRRQKISAVNPQKHISEYRDNLMLLDAAREDLLLARSLLTQVKLFPAITIWKVFLYIIGFLAFLAVTLYFVWNKQSKMISATSSLETPSKAEAEQEAVMPKEHEAKQEKEVDLDDIENIMKKDEDTQQ